MFELLVSEAIGPIDDGCRHFPLDAEDVVQEAVAWLQPRGYVEPARRDEDCLTVCVLREPWEGPNSPDGGQHG